MLHDGVGDEGGDHEIAGHDDKSNFVAVHFDFPHEAGTGERDAGSVQGTVGNVCEAGTQSA